MPDVDGPQPESTNWAASIKSAECIYEYSTNNSGWVYSCGFSFDGKLLAFVSHDSTIYMVDSSRSPQEIISQRTPFLPFLSMKFISNNAIIVAVNNILIILSTIQLIYFKGTRLHSFGLWP